MWLAFVLLALMASGSACPDVCACRQGVIVDRDSPLFADVTCRGRVPDVRQLPDNTRRLALHAAQEYEAIAFLEQVEASVEAAANLNGTPSQGKEENCSASGWPLVYLHELAITNSSLTYLNASWRGLERVRALNLSHNRLERLSDARVANLAALTCLDLSDNRLKEVKVAPFRTLSELVRLLLRRNEIAVVHEDAFCGLDRLEFLDLSDNRLSDLPDSALTSLYSLQKLDLSGNQLQVLGARWFESLDKLRELDVSRNGLAKAASGTLQPLPGLSVLRLAENPLKEKDVSLLLGTGRRLETVDASRTGLARVPAALTRSVRALRLAGNKLTSVRRGDLDSYPLLRMLDVSDNRLSEIEEDALGRLEVLEELDISGNLLTKAPGSLPSSLTLLKLQRNSISALRSEDFQELRNLRCLMLNDNDIKQIEVGTFGQLAMLTELDLSDNPMKVLPVNAISGATNLAVLRMSGLDSLQEKAQQQGDMAFPVETPERLVTLDVSRSPVLAQQLLADDAALSACKSLLQLDLSETKLSTLRSDLPYMLPQLRVLGLAGNPWNCSEDLYWLGQWLREHKKEQQQQQQQQQPLKPGANAASALRCTAPAKMSSTYIHDLPSPPSNLPSDTASDVPSEIAAAANATSSSARSPTVAEQQNSTDERKEGTTRSPRVYEAPTSFRNVTTLARKKDRSEEKNVTKEMASERQGQRKSKEKVTSMRMEQKFNKIVSDRVEERKEEARKLLKSEAQLETQKGRLVLANGAALQTIAQQLNGHATNSGGGLSEQLSGAHPGMLILVGAALGAAAALTVVLSRRANVRRRDRYHRHENIEVHTLTPSADLW